MTASQSPKKSLKKSKSTKKGTKTTSKATKAGGRADKAKAKPTKTKAPAKKTSKSKKGKKGEKKPLTGYQKFMITEGGKIQGLPFKELSAKISEMWSKLSDSEKQAWKNRTDIVRKKSK
eukprot:CAMPEP_0118647828 /NCGR_PEP_ID=MMETSP0785-20121206/8822_1 /TAXON_ID=91992 /ORGANISM="Bolidomonas pacifica, Strain CCMP 1866" /LENGTH=118 /DNA_ID=CAMNT_0006539963 /DNA_START=1 /DNA_END=357 /DNA_ORIENTATION=-